MEEQISRISGVSSATIAFPIKQLRITAELNQNFITVIQDICSSIEAEVIVVDRNEHSDLTTHKDHETNYDLPIILIGGTLLLIGELSGLEPLLIIAYLTLGTEILITAVKNLFKKQLFDENFLMSIATLGALLIGQYDEAVGVMLFYRIGELFEHAAVEKSRRQIMDAIDLRPETVNQISGDSILTLDAALAQPGDILLIRPGDRIPLDGTVIDGASQIDTSPITGEPVPVKTKAGAAVISGCINIDNQLKIRVDKPLSESMVTRILDSVENAAASKPRIDRFITRFARIYTPIVVSGALATAIIPSLITNDWSYWVYTALTFLVMSCPCALVLSVPLAFFSGIGAGSRNKILFKGGAAIEALNKVKAVVLDKTGTITKGNFIVQEIISTGTYTPQEILSYSASCEQSSNHPIAASIVLEANKNGLILEYPSVLEEISGHGIKAALSIGEVLIGNHALMKTHQISIDTLPVSDFGSEVYIAINGHLAGRILIADTLKADAKSAIDALKRQHICTAMLTGDTAESANAIAKQTGIDEVHAKLLPEDKLSLLKDIRDHHGAVMFVGDGINDAPVLAGADVGAAMGSGADAAIEAADVVFMTSDMAAVPKALAIASSSNRIALQNVVFALALKILVMILGLLGFASMWMAVFADTGVAMLCILNSIRILYRK
jgi:Cd2+/Zn2+-exporting ATPase